MASTYEPIATTTLGSAASSITFSSIPSTYTDLRLVLRGQSVSGLGDIGLRFNNDATSTYSMTNLRGNGTAASSGRYGTGAATSIYFNYFLGTFSPSSFYTIDIMSYAGSTYKTSLITLNQDQNGSGGVQTEVALWQSTTAINRIDIYAISGSGLDTGTTATLYGIKSA